MPRGEGDYISGRGRKTASSPRPCHSERSVAKSNGEAAPRTRGGISDEAAPIRRDFKAPSERELSSERETEGACASRTERIPHSRRLLPPQAVPLPPGGRLKTRRFHNAGRRPRRPASIPYTACAVMPYPTGSGFHTRSARCHTRLRRDLCLRHNVGRGLAPAVYQRKADSLPCRFCCLTANFFPIKSS